MMFMEVNKDEFLLDHADEIFRLQSVTTPDHLKENEAARQWRRNKYILRMCSYSFDLLITYLHDQNFMALLSLINQHIQINGTIKIQRTRFSHWGLTKKSVGTVFAGQPQQNVEHRAVNSESPNEIYVINKKNVMWGILPEQRSVYEKAALPPDVIPESGSVRDMVGTWKVNFAEFVVS